MGERILCRSFSTRLLFGRKRQTRTITNAGTRGYKKLLVFKFATVVWSSLLVFAALVFATVVWSSSGVSQIPNPKSKKSCENNQRLQRKPRFEDIWPVRRSRNLVLHNLIVLTITIFRRRIFRGQSACPKQRSGLYVDLGFGVWYLGFGK